jgi:NAD+ diphosphatase
VTREDENREASARTGFAGGRLNRSMEKRGDTTLAAAVARTDSRWLAFTGGRLVLKSAGQGFATFLETSELGALQPDCAEAVLLGYDTDVAVLAVPAAIAPDALPEGFTSADIRSVYREGALDRQTMAAVAQGSAMLSWHGAHRFCGRCGGPNAPIAAGAKRKCTVCDAEHFPRTDPVVIMLTVRGDFCLLARGPHFPEKMVSCLAGFIEPGETMEEAVRRETLEEAGLATGKVTYHASQPWPFPHSLMIGCYAEALDEELALDKDELESGRWFSRSEIIEMLGGNHPEGWILPPPQAIATLLIEDWVNA